MSIRNFLAAACCAVLAISSNGAAAQDNGGAAQDNGAAAQDAACPYLEQYLAPFELPVETWPEPMVGPPPGVVEQRLVGPEACPVVEERVLENVHGTSYRHITMAVTGTVFGYAALEGRMDTFEDHFYVHQTQGQTGPFMPGTARYAYAEETPASLEILLPQDPADWNGTMWILAHGAGDYEPLLFQPRQEEGFNRYQYASEYAGELIDRGYAVVWTRRATTTSGSPERTEITARLDDGSVRGGPDEVGFGFNNSTALLRDYAVISRNVAEAQLGRRPDALLYRGHSAGGILAKSFLFIPGMNTDHDGERLFDGFFISDTAGGRGAPTYFFDGEVVDEHGTFELFQTETDYLTFDADQTRFAAPVIETAHGAYAGSRTSTVPRISERVPSTYAQLKRENARMYVERGLGDWWRFYEIADVSHLDASWEVDAWPELADEMVDIGGISVALNEALVDWVRRGAEPPASRVDAADVRAVDPSAGPAVRLPESACPRGVYREYMPRPDGSVTHMMAHFVPYLTEPREQINTYRQDPPPGFDPDWLEPLDAEGYLVDMTGSGTRMTRPTIEQAWKMRYRTGHDTGVLKPYETLTRTRYAACVAGVAADLRAEGLLTQEAEAWYLQKALTDEIGVD